MRTLSAISALLIVVPVIALSQSSVTRIPGVDEPPELAGKPKAFTKPPEALRPLIEAFPKDEKDAQQVRLAIENVTKVLQELPDYSDGYFMRAMFNRCMLSSTDTDSILGDIDTAMSLHAEQKFPGAYETLADHYSLKAKIKLDNGQYKEALDDLQEAMKQNIQNAAHMFNSNGTEPDASSPNACTWSLSDLDVLIQKFPRDFRATLFRGLYISFFVAFDEKYYEQAIHDFQKAALVNPQSPLPHYYIGYLHTRASFWTRAAASDEGRNDAYRRAILAYTKALQLDARFLPAYELRADAFSSVKQYREAIKDYDKALELNPKSAMSYSDRGLAKMEIGQSLAAIADFGDAITRKKPDDHMLWTSYDHRADAYISIGRYRDAVKDYSKAIERQLANMTLRLSLKQIRNLYPEYSGISDDSLGRKIHALFWPEFEYAVIEKQLEGDTEQQVSFVLGTLYEKRGDAYLRANDFPRGVLDFNRIFKGIPDFADTVERWRQLGSSPDEEYYLDVKSAESDTNGSARLWVKTVSKKPKPTYAVQALEVDCRAKRLNVMSVLHYDSEDRLLNTSDVPSGWQRLVPDSRGEQLFNGVCSTER